MGGVNAVWDVRRINTLRTLLALNALTVTPALSSSVIVSNRVAPKPALL